MNVSVIGLGAMGGGMARALLKSPSIDNVAGFDLNQKTVENFFEDAQNANKSFLDAPPKTLCDVINEKTNMVVLVLQNEPQCQSVCFGASGDGNVLSRLPAGACVVLCSTVTATWTRHAAKKFEGKGNLFVDCPISGGPLRARDGTLSMFASGDDDALDYAKPALNAMGKDVHIIQGGAGMGSTVKMVHQLLAGVHIVAAGEALALAAKAGLDVNQMYDIVNGAAGASWMFQDRGQRMLQADTPPVKSATDIFVKDLDIVYAEAKRLQCPIPIASSALQQFVSAQSLGLGKQDDSQVVQVYERISGVSVRSRSQKSARTEGDNVGDLWKMEDGTLEEIVEVGDEPRHQVVLSNEYVRAIRVAFPPNDTTLAHRHAEDSLYFFLVEGGLNVLNHVKGMDCCADSMDYGEVRFGTHKSDKPLVHKITNKTDQMMLCVDAEVLKSPPVTSAIPMVADKHECIKSRDKCRVYKLTLEPGESVTVSYPFFYLSVILQPGTVEQQVGGRLSWTKQLERGQLSWHEPVVEVIKKNAGGTTFIEYIAEWR